MMIFRDLSIWFISYFMKMRQINRKVSKWSSKKKEKKEKKQRRVQF